MKSIFTILLLALVASNMVFGQCETGLYFDNHKFVTLPYVAAMDPVPQDFTIQVKVQIPASAKSKNHYYILDGDDGQVGLALKVQQISGVRQLKLTKSLGAIAAVNLDESFDIEDNQPHFVSVTRDNGRVKLYVDGVLKDDQPNSQSYKMTGVIRVACHNAGSVWSVEGRFGEISLWGKALDISELGKSLIGNETGLFGYWPMNDVQGQVVPDHGPNSLDGHLGYYEYSDDGDPEFEVISNTPTPLSARGISFSGSYLGSSHISDFDLGQGDFTFETIFRNPGASELVGYRVLLSQREASANSGFLFGTYQGNKIWLKTANRNMETISLPQIEDGSCHHIAVTRSGTSITFYLDGEIVGTQTSGLSISSGATRSFYLGNERGGQYGEAEMHHARIWSVARSQEGIRETMNSETVCDESGLLAYWKMDDFGSLEIADHSGNAHNLKRGFIRWKNTTNPIDIVMCNNIECDYPSLSLVSRSDKAATVAWTMTSPVGAYRIRYTEANEEVWVYKLGHQGERIVLEDLEPSTDYRIQVVAMCDENTWNGGFGNQGRALGQMSFTTEGSPPCQGQHFTQIQRTENSITVHWSEDSYKDYWNLRYRLVGSLPTYVDGIVDNQYTINGLTAGEIYGVELKGFCGDLSSSWKGQQIATLSATRIGEENLTGVTVYPNPSAGDFNVIAPDGFDHVVVMDALGNVIENWSNMTEMTLGEEWISGVYFMTITKGNFPDTYRLMKQ